MKRITVVLAAWIWAVSGLAAAPAVGESAPDFVGTDSKGGEIRLSDFAGEVVVLEWTNHDCPYVRKHYGTGNMQALQKRATERGVVWLSVISSAPGKQGHVSAAEANRLTEDRDASPTAVILDPDGTIGRLYAARTTPHMFIVDESGALVFAGGIDDQPSSRPDTVNGARNYVDAALGELLDGRSVSITTSRPYGCSVKY
jgi:peroxiredoxin